MRIPLILAGVLALAGCAVATTGVVPANEGMFTITRQGEGAWVQPSHLTALATQEADAYCKRDSRSVKVVHTKEIPSGLLGRWPESEILFRCER